MNPCDWSGAPEAGFVLGAVVFGVHPERCVVGGMSRANGDARGGTEGAGTAAPGPFSFSPEPTLEDM